jgi:glycerol-1-phosphate dehydrogenase [NAD(P)+]
MKHIWPVPKQIFMPMQEISDHRQAALITTHGAWEAVKSSLNLNIVWSKFVDLATIEYWDRLLNDFQGDVIYAIGGGLSVDTAKYLGMKKNLPVVCIPTALSVDAFTAWSSGYRENGCVRYLPTKIAEEMIIDLDMIARAPEEIRAAAICDLLSIATGSWDWEFAEKEGKNSVSERLIPYIQRMASSILHGTLDCAKAAGSGDHGGLKQLLDCVILETQMLNQIGHARPEEGSEHYFAYLAENFTGPGLSHASLVCPGILILADLQGQDIAPLKMAMQNCHIPLNTLDNSTISQILEELPDYCLKHDLPYGIAHTLKKEIWSKIQFESILN